MNKNLILVIGAILLLVGCGGKEGSQETLTGKGYGHGGEISVTVIKSNDKITKIEVVAKDETPGISDHAIKDIPEAIIKANSTAVDAVSGATNTSKGIIDAVNNALDPEKYPFKSSGGTKSTAKAEDGVYTGSAQGYGGELTVEVTFKEGKISDVELKDHNESYPVISRAFPVLKERVLEAQTPVVDSVTSATFSSFGVKAAVAEASNKAGLEMEVITMQTNGPVKEIKDGETVTTDLLIVGGGPAGLTAAMTAKELGIKNVIIVEKLDILSGNGKFDMVFFDMADTIAQKGNNITDSAEALYNDKVDSVIDSPERTRIWADGSTTFDSWLRNLGIEMNYNYIDYGFRTHMPEEEKYTGELVQEVIEKRVYDLGVDVRTGTKGTDLLVDGSGAVIGVKVEDRETRYEIYSDAVILATGGFAVNKDLIKEFAPGNEIIDTDNSIGATGDFIPVFKKNGYQLANMDVVSIFKTMNAPSRDLTGATGAVGASDFILVNNSGKRFVDESISGLKYAEILLAQPGKEVFYIYDQELFDKTYRLRKHVDKGYHVKADTLEELAEKLKIPAEVLIEEVETYNDAVLGNGTDPFRAEDKVSKRTFNMDGPFYGARVQPAIHMTKGGVLSNEHAQVINESGEIVENLYAAGEITATSVNYSGAIIWGRIAGEEAAKYLNEQR